MAGFFYPSQIPLNQDDDYGKKLGQVLMQQGSSSAPTAHWMQGVGRMASAAAGAGWRDQAVQAQNEARQKYFAQVMDPNPPIPQPVPGRTYPQLASGGFFNSFLPKSEG